MSSDMFKCFALFLTLLFSDDYTLNVPDGWTLPLTELPPAPAPFAQVTELRIYSIGLPTGLDVKVDSKGIYMNQTDCLTILLDLPAVDWNDVHIDVCGGVMYEVVPDAPQTCGYHPMRLTDCDAQLKISFGPVNVPFNLCATIPNATGDVPKQQSSLPSALPLRQTLAIPERINQVPPILRALQRIAARASDVLPVSIQVTIPTRDAIHFQLTTRETVNADTNTNINASALPSIPYLNFIYTAFKQLSNESLLISVMGLMDHVHLNKEPMVGVANLLANLPPGIQLSFDLLIPDFQCSRDGYTCTISRHEPVVIDGVLVKGFNTLDAMANSFAHLVSSTAMTIINRAIIPAYCQRTSDDASCSFVIPHHSPRHSPPLWLLILLPLASVVCTVLIVAFNLRRHRRTPLVNHDGSRVSEWRIIVEDSALCMVIFGCMACFITSNITSAATVVIGGEVTSYAFGLINTVSDLWKAGLQPLSFFVMVFSGIYPYFKLLCMLLYTVLLYRPDSMVLKIIDVIGKFSFLDMFVMLIFVSGLEIPGVADVNILASFYLFMGATTFSIACGNYATNLWRRGTSVRSRVARDVSSSDTNPLSPDVFIKSTDSKRETDAEAIVLADRNIFMRFLHRVWWLVSIPAFVLVLCLTIPCIAATTLSYRVGGVASITAPPSDFTLVSLASAANVTLLLLVVITVILAPLLFAIFTDETAFIGAWTAADVMLLACVAGLLQLNQFVQFILGGDYDALYSADAQLHWPLIPLLIAALLSWALQILHLCGVRPRWEPRLKRWLTACSV